MARTLGPAGLKTLEAAISRLDPDGRLVELDINAQTVKYGPEIRTHVGIFSYTGENEPVRAYLVAWLCTDGGYLPANIELEKLYSVGRPKGDAKLDILVNHADGTPYALIDVTAPDEYDSDQDKHIEGRLFAIAPHEPGCSVLSYATVDADDHPTVRAVTIPMSPGLRFQDWVQSRIVLGDIPANYGEPAHVHLTRDGVLELQSNLPARALEALRKRLHDVLWRATTPDNLVYEYVVKLFLAKIHDEKTTGSGDRYRFQIMYSEGEREPADKTFARVSQLYTEAYDRYVASSPRDEAEPFDRRDFSPEQIAFVVELLQGISLTSADRSGGDLLGRFFEAITREGFKQSKGLFFTHLNLAVFLLKAAGLEDLTASRLRSDQSSSDLLPYVIDPSAGSGTFLLSAMRLITEFVTSHRDELAINSDVRAFLEEQFPADHPNAWAKDFLYGLDSSALLAMSTKVNMVLHGDGNARIYHADGLQPLARFMDARLKGSPHEDPASYSRAVAESFDVVVSNPPFSITLPPHTIDSLSQSFELAGQRNSENLFLERWYQLLKPGGRLAVVLLESTFSTRENFAARSFLLDHFDIKAIVSLPRHAFEPWTSTRTCLLFAAKKSRDDERAWRRKRTAAMEAAQASKSRAQRLARKVAKAAEAVDRGGELGDRDRDALTELNGVLSGLGLNEPREAIAHLSDDIAGLLEQLKMIDADSVGLRAVAKELGTEYTAITVSSIGYRRTKRSEYNRPNELFHAIAKRKGIDGRTSRERVLNLNLGAREWDIEIDNATSTDVLTVLQTRRIWD